MPKAKERKWKLGDGVSRKRAVNWGLNLTVEEKRQIEFLAKRAGMSQADYMRDLLYNAYREALSKEGKDVPPTLINAKIAIERLADDLLLMINRFDWLRHLITLTAEYRHEVLADRIQITEEIMSQIKDHSYKVADRAARRTKQSIPKLEQ